MALLEKQLGYPRFCSPAFVTQMFIVLADMSAMMYWIDTYF